MPMNLVVLPVLSRARDVVGADKGGTSPDRPQINHELESAANPAA
jgi:hypothetical protein